jgi:hypothetical protein
MLIQVLAPVTFIGSAETPGHSVDTTVDLDLLSTVDLHPSGDLAHGWFDPSEGAGTINLIYRDASVIPVQEWAQWSGMGEKLDGWFVITHTFPVPSPWFDELEEAGIDCYSFLPPNGFHCNLQGHTVEELTELNVEGIVKLDGVDKVRENLVKGITGLEMNAENLFVREGVASANLVSAAKHCQKASTVEMTSCLNTIRDVMQPPSSSQQRLLGWLLKMKSNGLKNAHGTRSTTTWQTQ